MIEELKKGGSIYDTTIIGVNREFKKETGKMSIGVIYFINGIINKMILDECVTTSKLAQLIRKNENLSSNNIVDIKNSQVIDSINETINWVDKTTNELNDRIWAHNTCGVIKNAADEAAEFHKNKVAKDCDYTQLTNAYSKLVDEDVKPKNESFIVVGVSSVFKDENTGETFAWMEKK